MNPAWAYLLYPDEWEPSRQHCYGQAEYRFTEKLRWYAWRALLRRRAQFLPRSPFDQTSLNDPLPSTRGPPSDRGEDRAYRLARRSDYD